MGKHKILSHEETMELVIAAQNGSEEARERLVECNTRLVWSMVQRFKNRGYDLEDLFQIGSIGLLKAIDKFNTSYDFKFATYAVPMIIGEIQRFIRDDGTVRVPRSMKELANKIRNNKLVGSSPEHIMEVLDVDNINLVKDTLQYIKHGTVKSMEEIVFKSKDGGEITLADQLEGDVNGEWFNNIALRSAFDKLEDQERKIVELRYFKDFTQVEVAKELGFSQVHVSRLEKRIMEKMKALTEEEKEMTTEAKGNRKEAIKLLKETDFTYKQIAKDTGVPFGTVGALAKEHRPKEVADSNLRKGQGTKKKKEVKPVKTPVINEPAFMGEKDKARIKAEGLNVSGTVTGRFQTSKPNAANVPKSESQTVAAEHGEIVVRYDSGEEAFRVKDKGATVVLGADIETTQQHTTRPSVSFSVSVSLGGENVSKDEALESLKKAMDMVKLVPSDTINLVLNINN